MIAIMVVGALIFVLGMDLIKEVMTSARSVSRKRYCESSGVVEIL